ncbi:MAG: hypothetical protein II333_07210 [Clostridia bacterium]|nr:hypothetical protein [Clostridia bacterium]
MYIIYHNNRFAVSASPENAVVTLESPRYRTESGDEYVLAPVGNGVYEDAANRAEMTVEQKSDTLFYIHRRWTNVSEQTARIQTVFRVTTNYVVDRYLIPCVNVNGNEFGAGGEPKGLERDGKKWIFGYDRESIPACTLTENAEFACGLFASAESDASLESACSLSKNADGTFVQEIFHPVIESPVTYAYRDAYGPEYQTYLEIAPGETFECGVYLSVSRPRWTNFGIADVMDSALGLYGDPVPYPAPDREKIWNNSIVFAKSLITDYKGKKGTIIGFLPDGKGGFAYRGDECFELAWCGQNILFCRMFIEDYIRNGCQNSLDEALEILDTRAELCTAKSGLLAAQLKSFENLDAATADILHSRAFARI